MEQNEKHVSAAPCKLHSYTFAVDWSCWDDCRTMPSGYPPGSSPLEKIDSIEPYQLEMTRMCLLHQGQQEGQEQPLLEGS